MKGYIYRTKGGGEKNMRSEDDFEASTAQV
jgi:hypothetical protein